MPTTYKTPGVYIEEIPKFPPSVAQVETAIPAFIGHTQKAQKIIAGDLNLKPTRISSLMEYEQFFGGPQPEDDIIVTITEVQDENSIIKSLTAAAAHGTVGQSKHPMYYALQMFYANGGGPCYIISVGLYGTFGTAIDDAALENGLIELEKVDEPTLIVFPEGQYIGTAPEYFTLMSKALDQCAKLQDRFVILDLYDNSSDTISNANTFRNGSLTNVKYGAAYYPNIKTVLNYKYNDADITIVHNRTVENLTTTPPTITNSVVAHTDTSMASTDLQSTIYYSTAKSAIEKLTAILSPAAPMAGIYARVDSTRGVWKARANEVVNGVVELMDQITDEEQSQLNVDVTDGKSINAIRSFTGKGIRVWGARTLAGNDNEWRYVSVRRFFNMVEESVKKATIQFVFEPNDANTWTKVRAMIENYLTVLWRQGALAGAKPEHAFYVLCGLGQTMTAFDVLEGRMNVEIGMAAVRPAEFIILKFSHKMQES